MLHVKRIGRYMLNGLTALSLVLCVAIVVVWVRSYWFEDSAEMNWRGPRSAHDRYTFFFEHSGSMLAFACSRDGHFSFRVHTHWEGAMERETVEWEFASGSPGSSLMSKYGDPYS